MKRKKKQQNMDEIDKTTTENSVEIKKFTLPTVPSEDETRKRNRQNKEHKQPKKIITSSAAKNLAKNLANKALDKAPHVIDTT